MSANSNISAYREILRNHMPDFSNRYHVRSLALFRSRVRGDAGPDSDLDVLVSFQETPTLFTLLKLENEISDRLGLRVDLVIRESLRAPVAKRVLADLVPV